MSPVREQQGWRDADPSALSLVRLLCLLHSDPLAASRGAAAASARCARGPSRLVSEQAPSNSTAWQAYNAGVKMGCWGLVIYAATGAICSGEWFPGACLGGALPRGSELPASGKGRGVLRSCAGLGAGPCRDPQGAGPLSPEGPWHLSQEGERGCGLGACWQSGWLQEHMPCRGPSPETAVPRRRCQGDRLSPGSPVPGRGSLPVLHPHPGGDGGFAQAWPGVGGPIKCRPAAGASMAVTALSGCGQVPGW